MSKRNYNMSDFNLSYYTSKNEKDKRFGCIYAGMLQSEAFKRLSHNARLLLITSIVHHSTTKNYNTLRKYCKLNDIDYDMFWKRGMFILSASQLADYGIDSTHIARHWRELIDKGFVVCQYNNRHRKTYNIYQFSNKWRDIN
ncbi:MAG: hypothetical protein IJ232_02315 [Lachnospiraceae bacterium]|nr:hypothetical protein [Lachnospiraceae bacterium]